MISAPEGFPLALFNDKMAVYLKHRTWSSRLGTMKAYVESYTPAQLIITPTAENTEGFFMPGKEKRNHATFSTEGKLVRWYNDAAGVRRTLTDRMTITGYVEWLPIDPESEYPLGVCEYYVNGDVIPPKTA